jgi:hypothetical protein
MLIEVPSSVRVLDARDRIYLNPAKFWEATKDMTDQDLDEFSEKLVRLAEERKIEELRRYDFIFFGRSPLAEPESIAS